MMRRTPKSLRLQIGIFGRTNVGKSTFLNYVTHQNVAVTSSLPGTTTDIVEKSIELLPIGPVVFLDTAGVDDISPLAKLRAEKTRNIFKRADVFVLVVEPDIWGQYEEELVLTAKKNRAALIVVVNKIDIKSPGADFISKIKKITPYYLYCSCLDSANRDKTISEFKQALSKACPDGVLAETFLVGDLVPNRGVLMLIVPIDIQAPKGRLILPQVQVLRDALDNNIITIVVKDDNIKETISKLKELPSLAICDSQVVDKMVSQLPSTVSCTTFSILFTRYKGDLAEAVKGAMVIDSIEKGDRILIAESCSHHPIADDIGRVKIPNWIQEYKGFKVPFDVFSGRDYPQDMEKYKLVIHCGGCMLTQREMLNRIYQAKEQNVPITNYGVVISFLEGVLDRALSPFPEELTIYKRELIKQKSSNREKN